MSNQVHANHHIVSHDPATHQVPASQHQVHHPSHSLDPKKIPAIILAVLGFAMIVTGAIWYLNGKSFDFSKEPSASFVVEPIDETIIATVGSENIYAEDLKYKKSLAPEGSLTPELESQLKERLIEESIILQAGEKANLIELNLNVFNNPLKNQQERQKLITAVTDKINQDASHRKGAFVAIWFMNYSPGAVGYEAGKQIALEKITSLHQAVASGQMTIKQAGEAIESDNSLAQVDPAYKSNAYAEFDTRISEEVTFDTTFNQQLLSLEAGEVTEVYVAQDYEASDYTQTPKDAVYMFGQITEIQQGETEPFEAWLVQQKANYAVNYK